MFQLLYFPLLHFPLPHFQRPQRKYVACVTKLSAATEALTYPRVGMHGIRKCPTIGIIYRLKCRDTGIPQYFVTSSIVDNFCKNPTVRIVCSALADSLSHN